MKNPRAVIMIAVSVAVAIGAVVLASQWMLRQTKVAASKVVVTRNAVDLGTQLTPQMLKVVDWPKDSVPEGVESDPEKLKDRVLKVSLLSGEPVLESKLAPLGTKGGLSAVISAGKRAMTVRVNDVIGVAGFALPGNYVDILVSTEDDNSKASQGSKNISKIVLEHILVLAVAQEASRDETQPKVVNAVTLEVSPEQAEKLDVARSVGQLSLVLRNQLDTSPVETSGTTKQEMLDLSVEPPAAKASKKPYRAPAAGEKVEVIRGVDRSQQAF